MASASPRRRELLSQIGLEFQIVVSDVEEEITKTNPAEIVEELSYQKAEAVLKNLSEDREVLVIGADTIVASGEKILGKPANEEDAINMLSNLQGKSHEVYTGVTLLYRGMSRISESNAENDASGEVDKQVICKTFHEATKVHFYPMSEQEIREYVSTKDPLDKAGAYGIQGFCARYISGIEGDYNNVVGLPVGRLYQEVKEWL